MSRECPRSSSLVRLVSATHSSGMQSKPTCQLSLLCSPEMLSSSNCTRIHTASVNLSSKLDQEWKCKEAKCPDCNKSWCRTHLSPQQEMAQEAPNSDKLCLSIWCSFVPQTVQGANWQHQRSNPVLRHQRRGVQCAHPSAYRHRLQRVSTL